jgi:hypothetical protein
VAASQDQSDEKETIQQANKERNALIIGLLFTTAFFGVFNWFTTKTLFPDKFDIEFIAISILIIWLVAPIIFEFRIRLRRIDDKLDEALSRIQRTEEQSNL